MGLLLAAILLVQALHPASGYGVFDLDIGEDAEFLHWGKWGPDPRRDLFVQSAGKVRIWEQGAQGFSPAPTVEVTLPEEASLLDIGDIAGDEGEEIVLLNRRGVFIHGAPGAYEPGQGGAGGAGASLGAFRRILAIPGIPAPLEHARSPLIRDIDSDGKADLIVPTRSGYELYCRRPKGLEKVVTLEGEHRVRVETGGPGILEPLELEIVIPHLKFKDLNGDGRLDILARQKDKIRAYLQGPEGFKPAPTYELDLARFRDPESAGKGALGGALGPGGVRMHEIDIDGDGIQDYLIAAGQYLRVYFGTKDGADFSRPHTTLKLSSELQGVGSFDIDGDGRLDLVALKFELPGVPKLIAAYFVSMALDFEVLGYKNEGGRRFSRRPSWRNQISLSFPPLREVVEDFDNLADRFLEAAAKKRRFAVGDVNGDAIPDAVFLDEDHVLRVFFSRGAVAGIGNVKLGTILFDTKKNQWELRQLLDFVASASYSLARETISGRAPDIEIPLGAGYDPHELSIEVMDLNGDKRGDFVLRWKTGKLKIVLSRG